MKTSNNIQQQLTDLETAEEHAHMANQSVRERTRKLKREVIAHGWDECLTLNRRKLYKACQD